MSNLIRIIVLTTIEDMLYTKLYIVIKKQKYSILEQLYMVYSISGQHYMVHSFHYFKKRHMQGQEDAQWVVIDDLDAEPLPSTIRNYLQVTRKE